MRRVLSGFTVVEVSSDCVAASYCGKVFADLGAEVIKVEVGDGDPLRRAGKQADSKTDGGLFLHLNTNKLSVLLDPDDEADRARLAKLLERTDLVIASGGEGKLSRWGIDYDRRGPELAHLTLASITGFGVDGPYAEYKYSGIVAEAFTGTLLFQDRSDQTPVKNPGNSSQVLAGNLAAVGALAATMAARHSGQGRHVDCSVAEALSSGPLRAPYLLAYHYRDRAPAVGNVTDGAMAIPYGVYPCADGYVSMVTMIQQLSRMLDMFDDEGLRKLFENPKALVQAGTREAIDAVLYPWLLNRTRAEATAAAQNFGFPLTYVLQPEEVLEATHLHQRSFWMNVEHPQAGPLAFPGPPYRFGEGGWALHRLPPMLGEHTEEVFGSGAETEKRFQLEDAVEAKRGPAVGTGKLPLDGVRVIDMTAVFSGPASTQLLADLGAEVIRVENPWVFPPSTKGFQPRPTIPPELRGKLGAGYGPQAEGRPDRPYNRHSMNNSISRNKLSCAMDIRRPEAFELFLRLVDSADVIIENFKASSFTSMGIHPSVLQARNPGLIIARLPPTGLSGDWSSWTGFGPQFDSISGFLATCGHRDSTLLETPMTIYMDAATGPAAAFAILAALNYREATGRGQLIELAQTENLIQHLGDIYMDGQLTGRRFERTGNRQANRAPQGLYRARDDKWLAVSVGTDAEWAALATAIGRSDLVGETRFTTLAGRHAHHDELDDLIGAWAKEQDAVAAFHLLQKAGIAAAPLMNDELFVNDPQVRSREWLQPLHSSDVGTHHHPGPAFRGIDQVWRRGAPVLGEDNEYVYKTLLGVSEEDYARFAAQKILAEDYFDKTGQPY
jgi:crotonobetainyl-CoA:carnitine CoA-transferase CaiB-like acyl-CoA transferase